MKIIKLERADFDNFLKQIKLNPAFNEDFLYDVYCRSCQIIEDNADEINQLSHYERNNPYEHVYYVVGECTYNIQFLKPEDFEKLKSDEEYLNQLAVDISDKYLSLSYFPYQEAKFGNKFLPPISTITLCTNFFLNILSRLTKHNPRESLVLDLLIKSFKYISTSLSLLSDGHESEAFSEWRTLHECECILILLDKYGDPLIDAYNRHLQYALAYQGSFDKETTDKIFEEIKAIMKDNDLKSKDMKKFIEYGWIYQIDEVKNSEPNTYKLNFRDGVEKLAGLGQYAKTYELSSEIIHSTPILIYSDDRYFYYLTLICLYESFFRLEQVFSAIFTKIADKELLDSYQAMKDSYFPKLQTIYRQQCFLIDRYQKSKKRANKKE
ncbi:MAG: DUF5677 domain-containing protein [Coprobacillus sp.]|nr:DUF5677 domain-containing protein [Coprobacillus sp.]